VEIKKVVVYKGGEAWGHGGVEAWRRGSVEAWKFCIYGWHTSCLKPRRGAIMVEKKAKGNDFPSTTNALL